MANEDGPTPAETFLLEGAAAGITVDLAFGERVDASEEAEGWGADRTVRADFLARLCTGEIGTVRPYGVRLRGGKITGELELTFTELPYALFLVDCYFESPAPVNLQYVRVPALGLSGTVVPSLYLDSLQTQGDVGLNEGFFAKGEVSLVDAWIGGQLGCGGGRFLNPNGDALRAERMKVDGGVFLNDGFVSDGNVTLAGAKIGYLACEEAEFVNPNGCALMGDRLTVEGGIYLTRCTARGEVRLLGARAANLDCEGSHFSSTNKAPALGADRIQVEGTVFLNHGFTSEGEVRFVGARVGGFNCNHATFSNPGRRALTADAMTVRANVTLANGFKARGEVRLPGARVGGQLVCRNAHIVNPSKNAFVADVISVEGDLFLDEDFSAEGTVRLLRSKIGADLTCSGGRFVSPGTVALAADGATIGGSVYLTRGFGADGQVRLAGATIGGQFSCRNGNFKSEPEHYSLLAEGITAHGDVFLDDGFVSEGLVKVSNARIGGGLYCGGGRFAGELYTFDAERTVVQGVFWWLPSVHPPGLVNLADTRVGELRAGTEGWPLQAMDLNVDGFVYETWESPTAVDARLRWLLKYCSGDRYVPQPYEQLAATYRRAGHDADARTVAVGKEQARRATLSRWRQAWHWLFGLLVGYGHRLWRALIPLVLGIALGAEAFSHAHANCGTSYQAASCAMQPALASAHLPEFQPVIFAMDTLLPIIDLHQEKFWTPEDWYRWAFWSLIAAGWLLTTTVVAGLSRVLGRT